MQPKGMNFCHAVDGPPAEAVPPGPNIAAICGPPGAMFIN